MALGIGTDPHVRPGGRDGQGEEPFALAVEHPCYGRPEVFTTLEASREITAGPNLGI